MALDSPYTGIVDWRVVALQYGKDFAEAGGEVVTDCEVIDISVSRESPAGGAEGNTCPPYICYYTFEAPPLKCVPFSLTCRNEISD